MVGEVERAQQLRSVLWAALGMELGQGRNDLQFGALGFVSAWSIGVGELLEMLGVVGVLSFNP